MTNENNALKTKAIAPNLTKALVENHLASEQPATVSMSKEQVNAMFEQPAQVINNFQMLTAQSFVRLAFSENDASNIAHTRAVIAFDYVTLFKLKDMIDNAVAKLIEISKPEGENAVDETWPEVGKQLPA